MLAHVSHWTLVLPSRIWIIIIVQWCPHLSLAWQFMRGPKLRAPRELTKKVSLNEYPTAVFWRQQVRWHRYASRYRVCRSNGLIISNRANAGGIWQRDQNNGTPHFFPFHNFELRRNPDNSCSWRHIHLNPQARAPEQQIQALNGNYPAR